MTCHCIFGKFNAFATSDTIAVDASKKNAALNTIVRSNAVNSCSPFFVDHGLNRTSKNAMMKYFNTMFMVSKYAGATVAIPSSATAYSPYHAYNNT